MDYSRSKLKSSYLVNIFHTLQDQENLYFVMQYMKNGNLDQLLE